VKTIEKNKSKILQEKTKFQRLNARVHEKHQELMDGLIRKRRGITKKDIIYTALEDYFNPSLDENDSKAILAELLRMRKDILRTKFSVETLLDSFAVFVKIWMCHTNEIPKDHEGAAIASMNKRFHRYTKLVLEEIKSGHKPLLNFDSMFEYSDDLETGKEVASSTNIRE